MLKNLQKIWMPFVWGVLSWVTTIASAAQEPVPDFGELSIPPPLVVPTITAYFGISTAAIRDTTLILLANKIQCQTFLTKSGRRLYLLNGHLRSKRCEENNVMGIPNFVVPMPATPPKG